MLGRCFVHQGVGWGGGEVRLSMSYKLQYFQACRPAERVGTVFVWFTDRFTAKQRRESGIDEFSKLNIRGVTLQYWVGYAQTGVLSLGFSCRVMSSLSHSFPALITKRFLAGRRPKKPVICCPWEPRRVEICAPRLVPHWWHMDYINVQFPFVLETAQLEIASAGQWIASYFW